jgi:hypothetical protein
MGCTSRSLRRTEVFVAQSISKINATFLLALNPETGFLKQQGPLNVPDVQILIYSSA